MTDKMWEILRAKITKGHKDTYYLYGTPTEIVQLSKYFNKITDNQKNQINDCKAKIKNGKTNLSWFYFTSKQIDKELKETKLA